MIAEAPPTARQLCALAAALCAGAGIEFPRTRADASRLIERLRTDNGHPAPRLEDSPIRCRRRGPNRFARTIAVEVARELRGCEALSDVVAPPR